MHPCYVEFPNTRWGYDISHLYFGGYTPTLDIQPHDAQTFTLLSWR